VALMVDGIVVKGPYLTYQLRPPCPMCLCIPRFQDFGVPSPQLASIAPTMSGKSGKKKYDPSQVSIVRPDLPNPAAMDTVGRSLSTHDHMGTSDSPYPATALCSYLAYLSLVVKHREGQNDCVVASKDLPLRHLIMYRVA
jgi:hypothetical protein